MDVFDIALEKRFQENATISTLDETDVLLIMNVQTGTVLRVAVSALATLINTAISNSDILTALSAPYGVATLDSGSKIPASQLPSYVDDVLEFTDSSSFPATGEAGKIYIALNTNKTYRWGGSAYAEISASPGSTDSVTEGSVNMYHTTARASAAAPVQSVSGHTGAVTLGKSDVSLANVDNTSDADKPVSTAQAISLNSKASKNGSNSENFTAASFNSLNSNIVSAITGTWINLLTLTVNGIHSVMVCFDGDANVTDFACEVIVIKNQTGLRITRNSNTPYIALALSGNVLQVRHESGSTQNVRFHYHCQS